MSSASFGRVLLCVGLCGLAPAAAADELPPLMRHLVEVFEMPAAAAHDLLGGGLTGKKLHAAVLEAQRKGTAKLDKLMAVTASGDARIEQTQEYLYPTEHDPAQIPGTLAVINPGGNASSDSRQESEAAAQGKTSPFNAGLGILSTTTPTAFEMRPLGDILELQSRKDRDDGNPDNVYVLKNCRLRAVTKYGDVPLPVFAAKTLDGALGTVENEPAFLGTFSSAQRTGVPNELSDEMIGLAFMTTRQEAELAVKDRSAFDEPTDTRNLRMKFEVVSLNKADAHSLFLGSPDDADLYKGVTALLEQKSATRETVLVARVTSGVRAVMEGVDEDISPTEFDPPQLPVNLILANRELIADMRAGKQSGLGAVTALPGGDPNGGFGLITTLSPTAFEMATVGERLEVDPVVAGDIVDFSYALELIRRRGGLQYTSITLPVYERQRLIASARAKIGQVVCLGTLNKPVNTGYGEDEDEDRTWLAFLHIGLN